MMRLPLSLVASCATVLLTAQSITSVQDGAWGDPATWDCNCVPPIPANVMVQHHVGLSGPLVFGPMVQITPSGHLEQLSPGYIYCNQPCGLNIEGVLSSMNYMGTGCPVTLAGTWMAGGGLYAGLGLQMNGGLLQVNGNFSNGVGSTVNGTGQICVTDSTNIQGDLTGTIDICDLTPTTTVPPFVDAGASFIGPGITFCQGSVCSASVREVNDDAALQLAPNPASTEARIIGVQGRVTGVQLIDLAGRAVPVRWRVLANAVELELDAVTPGTYLVRVTDGSGARVVRLWKD